MSGAQSRRHFADTVFARLLALVVAALIGAVLYMNWAEDFRKFVAGDVPQLPIAAERAPVKSQNPALTACLKRRVGDVDTMRREGLISGAQHEAFKNRATELCLARNPG